GRGVIGSWVGKRPDSKLRSRTARRGPAWGLRPLCRGSIWYIGLPATAAAADPAGAVATAGAAAVAGLALGPAAAGATLGTVAAGRAGVKQWPALGPAHAERRLDAGAAEEGVISQQVDLADQRLRPGLALPGDAAHLAVDAEPAQARGGGAERHGGQLDVLGG